MAVTTFTVGSSAGVGVGRVGLGPMPAVMGRRAEAPQPARLAAVRASKTLCLAFRSGIIAGSS